MTRNLYFSNTRTETEIKTKRYWSLQVYLINTMYYKGAIYFYKAFALCVLTWWLRLYRRNYAK